MQVKSILKPEGSIVAGLATMGLVYGIYQTNLGPVAVSHATPANDQVLISERRKSGYTALVAVAAVGLLAKDPTIIILGGATIMAMEIHYRHAIMSNPQTGQVEVPGPQAYQPAQVAVPAMMQGPTG